MLSSTPELKDFPPLDLPERILLGPGPSMVHPRVLNIMSTPLIGHMDKLYVGLMDKIQELLRYLFETENDLTFPVSGTGSAGMETTLVNLVEPNDSVVVCINGYFGERLANMASRYTNDVRTIRIDWGKVFSPDEIEIVLKERPAKIVAIVQAETSTGVFQPTAEIAKIVHAYGGLLIVDAVTSLGGMSVAVDENGIDACYSCTQKCIGCPPGLSPVTFSSAAMKSIQERKTNIASWYFDLTLVQKYWGKERTYHHTAPITANYALYEGLRIILEEGLEARFARHLRNAEMLWEGLEELGLPPCVPRENRLVTITTVMVPKGIDEAEIRNRLMNEYNIEITGGLGEYKGKVWRFGLMGYSSRSENILLVLSALKQILNK